MFRRRDCLGVATCFLVHGLYTGVRRVSFAVCFQHVRAKCLSTRATTPQPRSTTSQFQAHLASQFSTSRPGRGDGSRALPRSLIRSFRCVAAKVLYLANINFDLNFRLVQRGVETALQQRPKPFTDYSTYGERYRLRSVSRSPEA